MFEDCQKVTALDVSNFLTPNVKYFRSMFNRCYALKSLDMSKATCKGTNPDGSNDNYSANAFGYMFYNCTNLESLDLRNFVYPGKAGYAHMFEGCINMKSLHLDNFGDISTYRYVNDYHLSVGSDTAGSLLGYNATASDPCVSYTNNALLIRLLFYNRNYNNTNTYMNYGYAIRNYCGAGKIVFKKTGFNNPWTFTGYDPATATGAPTVDQIVAPTE